jgi:hypothetical protein
MSHTCPSCGRLIRKRKPRLTEYDRLRLKIRKLQSAALSKSMPKATIYKQ